MESSIPQPLPIEGPDQEPRASFTESLCSACGTIKWSTIAEMQWYRRLGVVVMKVLATHDELRVSTCRVCRALAAIKPPILDKQVCLLKAFSSRRALVSSKRVPSPRIWKQCTVLAIVTEGSSNETYRDLGFLALLGREPADFDFGPRRILQDSIDYSHLKSIMSLCVEKHPEFCILHEPALVDGLRVIDCATKTVVHAPKDGQYIALSYVWGDPGTKEAITGSRFSPVVEDSIRVTMELGFRYLWVDRHCIEQDEADKHHMIRQMGRIYSNAFLTIIDAAGADAQYGLPGVGKRHRVKQLETSVQNCTLLQIFPIGRSSIKDTKWASRAWTYQEGYFSRRRLIFTDQQVIYLCNRLFAPESVVQPLQNIIDASGNRPFSDLIPNEGIFTMNDSDAPSDRSRSLLNQIAEYTHRQLSYERDSLDAFKGVLESYENDKRAPIYHLWGIPVLGRSQPFLSLLWYHRNTAKRRSGFPSRSWTGWAGGVSWLSRNWAAIQNKQITFSTGDGQQQPTWLFNVQRLASYSLGTAPRELQVTLPATTLRIETFSLTQEQLTTPTKVYCANHYTKTKYRAQEKHRVDGNLAVFQISSHIRGATPIFFDCQVEAGTHLIGLVFSSPVLHGGVVLVLKGNKHFYERVGLVAVIHKGNSDVPMLYLDNDGQILDEVWLEEQDDWAKYAQEMTLSLH